MQRAWAFMKVYKGYTLKSALRQAWIDAILAMEDYNYSQNIKPHLPKSGLTMKSLYANPTGDMANGYATRIIQSYQSNINHHGRRIKKTN